MRSRVGVAFFMAVAGGAGGGGAERIVITIANEFAKRGVDVDLVMLQATGPYSDLVSNDVNMVDLGVNAALSSSRPLAKMRRYLAAVRSLCRYIRERRPRVIASACTPVNLIALMARVLCGTSCRLVICQHGTMGKLSSQLAKRVARSLFPLADAVIAVSQGVADDLVEAVPGVRGKVRVVYNPVDMGNIERQSQEVPGHPWFDGGSQVILGVGGLKTDKDFPTLLRAFAKVREGRGSSADHPARPVRLVILGDGTERQRLEALVSELGLAGDVSLPGFVKNPYAYMRRSSVFVLSSISEGLPGVLLEALACGCPVVSTDCQSGPREILENGRWGELVPVGDAEGLAAAIGRTLEGPLPSEPLKSRAAFFAVGKAVEQYHDVLLPSASSSNFTLSAAL